MTKYHSNIIIICLIIFLTVSLFIYWHYVLSFSKRLRVSKRLVYSGITINSFNPFRLNLTFNTNIIESNILSIIDNNAILVQLSKPSQTSTITMILSDGFHHLDILLLDEIENIEFYQAIDIASGSQSLKVTVLDQQYKPVENISVHLELVDYSHITLEYYTNHFGEVIFHYLPKNIQIFIEAIYMNSKRHAFVEIDTDHYQNITLILKDMSVLHDDEYSPLDQGYYAS
ncbi:unnamed protein product [Rotaria sordida]|uniref:Uncharacterized protein n=1 Tax=Rotaria sordida TaxID=392033 RepID=A0A814RPZ0_9BILA|nr:unnamed protein product [Rotaria sordida]CAF1137214.1 unnamed protein product [Rotaria sordida]